MKKVNTKNKMISLLIATIIPLTITTTMYNLYVGTDSIMEKLLIAAIFFIGIIPLAFSMIFPILNMLLFGFMKGSTKKKYIPKKTVNANGRITTHHKTVNKSGFNKTTNPGTCKSQYKQNDNPNYVTLRDNIKDYSKSGKINREGILDFKNELDYRLGSNRYSYKEFSFENDMHEIYVKIKNSKFKDEDYLHLQQVLDNIIA